MDELLFAATLAAALGLFIWDRWRYDIVAMAALLFLTIAGVIEAENAFTGFSHPAVITVAAVLVVSRGLQDSGLVDVIGRRLKRVRTPAGQVFALTAITAITSAFMNNTGALAILMPVAVQQARSAGRPPSQLLMPIAFGSLLGGMTTLIGTPPNIIIAEYRAEVTGTRFAMFDFAPAGLVVAVLLVLAIGLSLWRLLPQRAPAASRELLFDIEGYTAELRVMAETRGAVSAVRALGDVAGHDLLVVGIARGDHLVRMPAPTEELEVGDVLVVEGDAEAVTAVAEAFELTIEGHDTIRERALARGSSAEIDIIECIVQNGGVAAGRTAQQLDLRRTHGVNLLGIARQGERVPTRVGRTPLAPGDVLLLQGERAALTAALPQLDCLPLTERRMRLGKRRRIVLAAALLATAVGTVVAAILPLEIAFVACAGLMVVTRLVSLRDLYTAIDWPVIVLLGAMIPVGMAMETTGAADDVATVLLGVADAVPGWLAVGLLMAVCMALSNVINNAAAAILMAPIAVGLATGLDAAVDPFLMATAIGSSAAFLTPIGHQSNTIVMGPGGYRFSDYLYLGIPASILTLVIGVPAILWAWPL